jgi:hypothetical protein
MDDIRGAMARNGAIDVDLNFRGAVIRGNKEVELVHIMGVKFSHLPIEQLVDISTGDLKADIAAIFLAEIKRNAVMVTIDFFENG